MTLKVDLKNISLFKKLKDYLGILLWVFLGIILLLVIWVAFGEISKISRSKSDTDTIQKKIVRVNMEKYKALENKLNDNATFMPQEVPGAEAFTPIVEEKPVKPTAR
jgi:hypothetical protein